MQGIVVLMQDMTLVFSIVATAMDSSEMLMRILLVVVPYCIYMLTQFFFLLLQYATLSIT